MSTQLEKINNELISIKGNVSIDDKSDFMKESGVSKFTVSTYLRGEGKSIDTGLQMLVFFRQRIKEREDLINGVESEKEEMTNE